MRTTPLVLTAGLSAVAFAAAASPASACNCRVGYHHASYRHTVSYRPYVRHVRYVRPYAYRYRTPVYYSDWGYDPYVYRRYYDWTYVPPVRVYYGGGPYYDDSWWWRRHHHWRGDWGWEGRGHWRGDHWDHGWHHGWR